MKQQVFTFDLIFANKNLMFYCVSFFLAIINPGKKYLNDIGE